MGNDQHKAVAGIFIVISRFNMYGIHGLGFTHFSE
jgi:hypothetical protein